MTWMSYLTDIDFVKLALVALKSAAGAVGGGVAGVLFRKVKGWIMPVSERCTVDGCGAAGSSLLEMRGMCLKCYGRAKKRVLAGDTTWEDLAALGLCKGDEINPFDRAFNKARDKGDK